MCINKKSKQRSLETFLVGDAVEYLQKKFKNSKNLIRSQKVKNMKYFVSPIELLIWRLKRVTRVWQLARGSVKRGQEGKSEVVLL